jgi:hypothetical protein
VIIVFVLFWVLIFLGLKDGDISPKEAIVYGSIWTVLLVCTLAFSVVVYWFVVPTVILDIILVLKVFGGDVAIR